MQRHRNLQKHRVPRLCRRQAPVQEVLPLARHFHQADLKHQHLLSLQARSKQPSLVLPQQYLLKRYQLRHHNQDSLWVLLMVDRYHTSCISLPNLQISHHWSYRGLHLVNQMRHALHRLSPLLVKLSNDTRYLLKKKLLPQLTVSECAYSQNTSSLNRVYDEKDMRLQLTLWDPKS